MQKSARPELTSLHFSFSISQYSFPGASLAEILNRLLEALEAYANCFEG